MICVKDNGTYKNSKKIGELTQEGYSVRGVRFDGWNTWLFFEK
jgi:hypothetical protein